MGEISGSEKQLETVVTTAVCSGLQLINTLKRHTTANSEAHNNHTPSPPPLNNDVIVHHSVYSVCTYIILCKRPHVYCVMRQNIKESTYIKKKLSVVSNPSILITGGYYGAALCCVQPH